MLFCICFDWLFIYQIKTPGKSHTGVLAGNVVQDFFDGNIKKHEKTLTSREAEYHIILRDWRAVLKPVLLTYPAQPGINQFIQHFIQSNQPFFEAEVDATEEQHAFWAVNAPTDVAVLTDLFRSEVPHTYIADGHHRTTTIAHLSQRTDLAHEGLDYSLLYSAYFADDQLDILGYHRLMQLDTPALELMDWLAANFEMEPLQEVREPKEKGELVVVTTAGAWALKLPAPEQPDTPAFDADLLNDAILKPFFKVENARSDKRISYVDGAKGAAGMVQSVEKADGEKVGFLLYPVSFSDLYLMSDLGLSLPPKSTWFEPRIKSGLAVSSL